MDTLTPWRQEGHTTMRKLKCILMAAALSVAWSGGAMAAGALPPPGNIITSAGMLTINPVLPEAVVTVSGPCVAPGHCMSGAQSDPNRLLATVTVTPPAGAQAALNVEPDVTGGEGDWSTGFEMQGYSERIWVMITLPGGTPPSDPHAWWAAGEPGQPQTWEIHLRNESEVAASPYQLTLLGGAYTN